MSVDMDMDMDMDMGIDMHMESSSREGTELPVTILHEFRVPRFCVCF